MKRVKITQNDYGRFNIFGDEDTMSFSLWIEEDGEGIRKQEGDVIIKCKLYYSEHDDRREEFSELFDKGDIGRIFQICLNSSSGYVTNGKTKEYPANNCTYFYKVYKKNKVELEKNWRDEKLKRLREDIKVVKGISFTDLDLIEE